MVDDFFKRANQYFETKRTAPPVATVPPWNAARTTIEVLSKIKRNRHPDRAVTLRAFRDGKAWAPDKAYALASWLCFYTGGMGSISAICELAEPSLRATEERFPDAFVSEAQFEELVTRVMVDARRVCDENRAIEERFMDRSFAQARAKFERVAALCAAPKETK